MAGLKIPCPKCQSVLKLKDRSLLGKKGKCPKCGHRFELTEPKPREEEVALELVEDEAPAEGQNPTWIPDEPRASAPAEQKAEKEDDNPLAGITETEKPQTDSSDNPLDFLQQEESSSPETSSPLSFTDDSPAVSATTSTSTGRRKRRRRTSSGGWLTMAITLLIVAGGGYFIYQQMQTGEGLIKVTDNKSGNSDESGKPQKAAPPESPDESGSPRAVSGPQNDVVKKSPTKGQPIQLFHMPAGVRVAVNLRLAELWSQQGRLPEFKASLGPLGSWLEENLTSFTRQQPDQIEEVLIGIILGARGTPPEFAAVVHLKEPQQKSALLSTYSGEPYEEFNTSIQVIDGRAYQMIDEQTISICPEKYVDDVLNAADQPAITATHLEEILEATDRQRLFTAVFDPLDIEQHMTALFPETAQMTVEKTVRWFGDDAAAAAWSLHLEEDFFSDLTILGNSMAKPRVLKSKYEERLNAIPELMLTTVQKMNPLRAGYRKIIGRFPAMLKVLSMTTAVVTDGQFVRFGTLMPPKAGPNLALGTLLTWDESTRTDFSVAAPAPVVSKPKSFEERLQTRMDLDFTGTPLQEVFAFISEEANIPIEIDGDAFKLAGFTKNMRQTIEMENATALEGMYAVIKNYEDESDPIVAHISKEKNKIIILTKSVAEKQNLETYDFSKLKQE